MKHEDGFSHLDKRMHFASLEAVKGFAPDQVG